MRPLRLIVQAFGPYAGRQVFDFGELSDRSLFLISGPTGAGKSTVLDGMCCALYGATSGGDRTPLQMRSDHAARKDATEVRLDFRLGERDYRALRRLEHERPKKRGDGTTTEPQGATLWDRTGIEDPDTDGTPLATQWEKVTRKVEELLGFREEEFRQVVVLPQGHFRELLMADSRGRERILATLFRTGRFSAVERALKDAWRVVETQLEALKQKRLCDEHGVVLLLSPPHYPPFNGKKERRFRDVKGFVRALARHRVGESLEQRIDLALRDLDEERPRPVLGGRTAAEVFAQDRIELSDRRRFKLEVETRQRELEAQAGSRTEIAAARRRAVMEVLSRYGLLIWKTGMSTDCNARTGTN